MVYTMDIPCILPSAGIYIIWNRDLLYKNSVFCMNLVCTRLVHTGTYRYIWILATYDIVGHQGYRMSDSPVLDVEYDIVYTISYIRYCFHEHHNVVKLLLKSSGIVTGCTRTVFFV